MERTSDLYMEMMEELWEGRTIIHLDGDGEEITEEHVPNAWDL